MAMTRGALAPKIEPRLAPRPHSNELRQRRIDKAKATQRRLAIWVSFAILMAGLAGFLVYRQARIVQANAINNALRREISELRYENELEQARFLKETDQGYIAREALRLFGLRKPSQAQRVVISLPKVDRIVRQGGRDLYEGEEGFSSLKEYMAQTVGQGTAP